MNEYLLAIDLGASSGRHILGHVRDGKMVLEEVYRFPNAMVEQNGHWCWDVDALFGHIVSGLKECAKQGKKPCTVGIDTWGVDFALLDKAGQRLGDCVAYRDDRTLGMAEKLDKRLPFAELYQHTGIARQAYNTIFQLMAVKEEQPELLENADAMLFMPCYLSYLLTGVKKNEYTIASTSGLLNAATRTWDQQVIEAAGLPARLFAEPPAQPGTVLGNLKEELAREIGFDTTVVLPACHDTASAFMAIENQEEDAVYLSSGTWSLLGVVSDTPITTAESMEAGFTNEGGGDGKIRYLQNIVGMWILQQMRQKLKDAYSFAEMAEMAERGEGYTAVIDPTDERFIAPPCMMEEIKSALRESGAAAPKNIEELLCCAHKSLATCYGKAIKRLEALTGKVYRSIRIFGGGCQNEVLNRWTQEATGLPVYVGPVEATALGNLRVQRRVAEKRCGA